MRTALIIGGADNVWEDAEAALSLFTPDAVFAVKTMIAHWPLKVDYGVTLHPEWTAKWLRERARITGRSDADKIEIWAHKPFGTVVQKVTPDWQGSSGLFAVKIALEEKFDGIVLAGVPMDNRKHFTKPGAWSSFQIFLKGWQVHMPELRDKVRSMSGWTKEHLGEPTPEWLSALGVSPPDPDRVANLRSRRCLKQS